MVETIELGQLGFLLRSYRRERELSLRDVRKETGVSPSTLSRVERGHIPDLEVVQELAKWLGVEVRAGGEKGADVPLRQTIEVHLRAKRNLPEDVARDLAALAESVMELRLSQRGSEEGEEPDG